MKKFLKSTGGKVCLTCLVLLLLTAAALGGYTYWHYQQPKFHSATIELGKQLPSVSAFSTKFAIGSKAVMVTPVEDIDLTTTGVKDIQFSQSGKIETVTLTVVDTTPPQVKFKDVRTDDLSNLKPEDFIQECSDLNTTTAAYLNPLPQDPDCGTIAVSIVVTDAAGNSATGECLLHYMWIQSSYTLEVGDTFALSDVLLNPERDAAAIDPAIVEQINSGIVGKYVITSTLGSKTAQCTVTVQDTVAPVLELQPVCIDLYQKVKLSNFVKKAEDASGEVTTRLLTELNNKQPGTYTVAIEAADINGNITTKETTLKVTTDATPPVFSGLTELKVQKGATPNYTKGVKATDAKDGVVSFTYDASKVDLTKAGTYYMTYTATDTSGNSVTKRRKVTVTHNAADTAALVSQVASGLSGDAVSLRNWVRSHIGYNSSWGGDDPVWYGLKNRTGNCYVHAMCLDALLKAHGYETQLIWVTDKSHYWNLVKIDGQWKHLDSTPGSRHSKFYQPMNDEERYSCLQGRDWDRTQWPACP